MTRALLAIIPLAPLAGVVAVVTWGTDARRNGIVAAAATVPALVVVADPPGVGVSVPWLLFGAHLAVDDLGRVMLLLTATVWAAAAFAAGAALTGDPGHRRFFVAFLLAMAGNLGVVVAGDAASFYLSFALMTFSAYGLVVHDGTPAAMRAGRVYIVMAVFGEAALLVALLLSIDAAGGSMALAELPGAVAGSERRDVIVALFLAGFGVKAGAPLVHLWLPLAHPAAPIPASAVLSGCMIKAGLIGWLRFLPMGDGGLGGWATLCVTAGLGAAFAAAAVGITQRQAKINLAYSSISQMGSMLILVGLGLGTREAAPAAAGGAALFALHHGLAKGALFLGVGVAGATGTAARRWVLAGLALPALALAGAPLTSGALAKGFVKDATAPGAPGTAWLDGLLPLTAVGTTVLMVRYLGLVAVKGPARATPPAGSWGPWVALLAATAAVVPVVAGAGWLEAVPAPDLVAAGDAVASAWPVVLGVALAAGLSAATRRRPLPEVPPGDLVVPLERVFGVATRLWALRLLPGWLTVRGQLAASANRWAGGVRLATTAVERLLVRWDVAGSLFLLAVLALVVVLWVDQ